MIRIAFLIDTINSPTAGTEKQLLLLLRRLDRSKYDPVLCVLKMSPWLEREFSLCPLHCLDIHSFRQPSAFTRIWRFSRYLAAERIDILQTHFKDDNKVGCLAGRLAGTRAVVSSRRNQGYWHTSLERAALRILNRWVTVFVANSRDTMLVMSRAEGVDERRYRVVYNGLEMEDYGPRTPGASASLREEFAVPADARIVLMVANLRRVKRVEVLLRAMARLRDEGVAAVALVAGEGEDRPRLEAMRQALGLGERVRLLGVRTDVPRLLAGADVGVLTSESESFSNSVIEYLAADLPVVCTEVGGVREAVEDGVGGFLVPPNDPAAFAAAIGRALAGGVPRGLNRARAASLFSADAMVRGMDSLYESALGAGAGVGK